MGPEKDSIEEVKESLKNLSTASNDVEQKDLKVNTDVKTVDTVNEEEVDDDESKENVANTCNFCKKEGPTKRCSKRHPKCLKKLFCNSSCEEQAHKKKTTATAATKKAEPKKKKKYTFKDPCQWAL